MATTKQAGRDEPTEAARDDSSDMFRGSPPGLVGRFRCGEVACNLHKMEKALNRTFLDIHSSNKSTIHPATGLLIQALQHLLQSAHHSSHVIDCWASKLEEDAEMVRPGEKGGKYIFLMNNTCAVLQMMRRLGASFSNVELVSRLRSMTQQYTKSYKDECWVPLNNTLNSNLDEFTAEFLAITDDQRTWKVTAELRYDLREEIVDLIVPSYKASLSALQADRSRLSGLLCSFKRVTAGKKNQKRYTVDELEKEIRALFEG